MNPMALLRAIDEAVMPLHCVFCGTQSQRDEGVVCGDCFLDLPWRGNTSMPGGAPLFFETAPLAYEFPIDAAIKLLKFRRRLYYGPALAQLACTALDGLPDDIDAILPVPLHWRRRCIRGFNQAREIAGPVAKRLGVPLIRDVRRSRATAPQTGLNALERTRNLRNAFVARRRIACNHVLIVDDVMTTGTTVRQLGRAVLAAGAGRVSALAVARAGP